MSCLRDSWSLPTEKRHQEVADKLSTLQTTASVIAKATDPKVDRLQRSEVVSRAGIIRSDLLYRGHLRQPRRGIPSGQLSLLRFPGGGCLSRRRRYQLRKKNGSLRGSLPRLTNKGQIVAHMCSGNLAAWPSQHVTED